MDTLDYALHGLWEEHGDPRVSKLPLFGGGPWKVAFISLLYLLFVTVWGPKFMKSRPAYELRGVMIIYNGFLIGFNAIGAIIAFWVTDLGSKTWTCEIRNPLAGDFKDDFLAFFGWMYFASKIADFMDTVFFILRKKNSQVTFLHVFHHGVMPLVAYFGIKFHPTGYSAFLPICNMVVHAIMYSYYAIAAAGPDFRRFLWWKKHITQMQIVQFVFTLLHSFKALIVPNCWPRWLAICEMLHAALFLYMFTAFYCRVYLNPVVKHANGSSKKASKAKCN